MVTGNYSWEEQTRRLLSEAQTEKNETDAALKELQEKSNELDGEIEAFKIAKPCALRHELTRSYGR